MADSSHSGDGDAYHPKDAVALTIKATLVTGGTGLFFSAIQNTLTRSNVGMMGIFTRTGSTVTTFAAMGAAYAFTSAASANLRRKDDSWNAAVGGLFGGSMLGLRFRSAPAVLGYGSAMAVVLAAFQFTGGQLQGYARDPEIDEVARKEYMRKNRRRPIDETLHQLGEGRGIQGPDYAERRAQRIKENYGIDVPVSGS